MGISYKKNIITNVIVNDSLFNYSSYILILHLKFKFKLQLCILFFTFRNCNSIDLAFLIKF